MFEHNSELNEINKEKDSLKELVLSIKDWTRYFFSRWVTILLFAMLGAGLGLCYGLIKKTKYTAKTSFVLETGSKTGVLGAYANLASNFGFDFGGAGGGLFEGENILELYRSRSMLSNTLLSPVDIEGKRQLLIDRYIEFKKLRKKWEDEPELKNIKFVQDNIYPTQRSQIIHDSIISKIVKGIDEKYLTVDKIDKQLNIVEVKVVSEDEFFAKQFNEKLVENVNEFYLDTKTKKNLKNVEILQVKTDSVRRLMTGSINRAVAVADATPNQNPTRMVQREAPIQNATANAEVNKEVLGTLLQNLELSKISLLKETPLIQIVDYPVLPLEEKKVGKLVAILIGGFISVIVVMGFLAFKRILKAVSE